MKYIEHKAFGMRFALVNYQRNSEVIPEPNFNNTGLALAGRLNAKETLEQFERRVWAIEAKMAKRYKSFHIPTDKTLITKEWIEMKMKGK